MRLKGKQQFYHPHLTPNNAEPGDAVPQRAVPRIGKMVKKALECGINQKIQED